MNNKVFKSLVVVTLGATLITGCSTSSTPSDSTSPSTPVASESSSPTPEESQSPEPTPEETTEPVKEPEPEIVADEYSQVIDGKLYQGSKELPVLIGEDTPGKPPAFEAEKPTIQGISPQLKGKNKKYLIGIMEAGSDGYYWAIEAPNSSKLANSIKLWGDTKGYFPTVKAARKSVENYKIDGQRKLNRAEYILVVQKKEGTYDYSFPDQK